MLHTGLVLHGGRYRLLSRLREGASGQVWRALDARTGREVALKAIPLDAGGAEAAEHEAEAITRVRHPGVVRVDGTFEAVDDGCIVIELARCSLADVVAEQGALDGNTTRAVARSLAEVLSATHEAGVVHRDIKPQNVLVLDDGSIRVADFGIARVHARGHSRTAALIGTLPYMAPEQRRDPRDVRPSTDVYAWAVLVAWMRTGVAPGEPYVDVAIDALRDRLRAAGEPDDALLDVIVSAGRYDPQTRLKDGREVVAHLRHLWPDASVPRLTVRDTLRDGGDAEAERSLRLTGAQDRHGARTTTGWTVARVTGLSIVSVMIAGAVGAAVARVVGPPAPNADVTAPAANANADPFAALPRCDSYARSFASARHMGPEETLGGTIADVDLDGLLDVVFSNQAANSISVWWGRPGALPETRTDIPAGRVSGSVAVLDANADGVPDIVVPRADLAQFGVLSGLGVRMFRETAQVFQGPGPIHAAAVSLPVRNILVFHTISGTYVRGVGMPTWPEHDVGSSLGASAPQPIVVSDDEAWLPVQEGDRWTLHRVAEHAADAARLELPPAVAVADAFLPWVLPDGQRAVAALRKDLVAQVRVGPGRSVVACDAGTLPPTGRHGRWGVADLDGDGVHDLVTSDTCAGCTSNHAFWRGVR